MQKIEHLAILEEIREIINQAYQTYDNQSNKDFIVYLGKKQKASLRYLRNVDNAYQTIGPNSLYGNEIIWVDKVNYINVTVKFHKLCIEGD